MRDYKELDAAIIEHIRDGDRGAAANHIGICDIARRIAPEVIAWRLVDRRLQWLRKNGRVQYDRRRGWSASGEEMS